MCKKSFVSIIIPIYNAEKKMCRCIDSILMQSFDALEIILIDDGSLDNSGNICDKYAKKDRRIKVIHQSNHGVSFSRQIGVNASKGEYVIHVDADDWIENNMIEELYIKAVVENADVVFCDYFEETDNKTRYCVQRPEGNSQQVLKQLLLQQLHGSCWNKLVKRTCYSAPNVHFPVGVNIYEDLYLVCQMIYNNVKIVYLPKAFYHYVINPNGGSLSQRVSMKIVEEKRLFIKLMSEKRFTDEPEELFLFKKDILFNLFLLRMYPLMYQTYPEIHDLIRQKNQPHIFNPKGYVLYMAFNKHLVWAWCFWRLSMFLIAVKNKIMK